MKHELPPVITLNGEILLLKTYTYDDEDGIGWIVEYVDFDNISKLFTSSEDLAKARNQIKGLLLKNGINL